MNTRKLASLLVCLALLSGCSKEIIEPELFGSIEGTVIDSQTGNGIGNVSIETTPATEAIVTNGDGEFVLQDVGTGSYLIKASKADYNTKSVNVEVKEDKKTSANLFLVGGDNGANAIQAEVTSWRQTGTADSSEVNVEFRVQNQSTNKSYNQFEVYFDIYNSQETLLYEVRDTSLNPGEINVGSFSKEVWDAVVDSVVVSGTWVTE